MVQVLCMCLNSIVKDIHHPLASITCIHPSINVYFVLRMLPCFLHSSSNVPGFLCTALSILLIILVKPMISRYIYPSSLKASITVTVHSFTFASFFQTYLLLFQRCCAYSVLLPCDLQWSSSIIKIIFPISKQLIPFKVFNSSKNS